MKKAIVIADIHYPNHDKKVFEIIKQIIVKEKPNYLVILGDAFDATGISKFTYKDFEVGFFETVDEMRDFKTYYFDKLLGLHKFEKVYYCLGNHCGERFDKLFEKLEAREPKEKVDIYKNLVNHRKIFKNVEICDYRDYIKIGTLHFTHGSFHSEAHAKKHALDYNADVIYGHLHTMQTYTAKTKAKDKSFTAHSIPCACKLNHGYMKNKSSSWVQGLAMVSFYKNNHFVHPIIIKNNKTIYNNKLYE